MGGYDAVNNIPTVLRDNGYFTGMVGKWHMMPDDDMGHNLDCAALELFPNEDLYEECKDILKEVGFDYIEAFFYGNVKTNNYFSHNPEWMVDEAQQFVDEALQRNDPFFLYFASTLVHSPDVGPALTKYGCEDTPAGKLAGAYDNPEDKTTMWSRQEVWDYSVEQARALGLDQLRFATTFWCDMQFGALIDALKMKGVYDDTLVILQNDHGQIAKGLLYEQGTRIMNFQRYPPLFGKERMQTLPDDFVTSNVDLAATIFQLAGVDLPHGYQMDGVSYLDDVVNALTNPNFDQVADGEASCEYKYLDIKNSHSMVSGQYQYIWRATDSVDTMYDVDKLYPNTYDMEQLYDLDRDPNQKTNIFNVPSQMMALSETIAKFETLMRIYVDEHCIATNGAQCVKPELRFGTSGGLYDLPTDGPGGPHTPSPTMPSGGGSGSGNPCDTVTCRGSQVCNEDTGVCERPSRDTGSGSGSGSSDGSCSSDGDCRGSQVCSNGVCGRPSRDTSGGGSSSGGGRGSGGSGGRGGGRPGLLEEYDVMEDQAENVMEEEETVNEVEEEEVVDDEEEEEVDDEEEDEEEEVVEGEEEMEFNGAFSPKTETVFSLRDATVNVSTLLMMFVMAMVVMIGRNCFWKVYEQKAAKKGVAVNYGTV